MELTKAEIFIHFRSRASAASHKAQQFTQRSEMNFKKFFYMTSLKKRKILQKNYLPLQSRDFLL